MASLVTDTFTDADNTALTAHTGELGATWTKHPTLASSVTAPKISGNKLVPGETSGTNAIFFASGVPSSPDYSFTLDITLAASSSVADGPAIRVDPAAGNGYFALLFTATGVVSLFKYVGGTLTNLKSVTIALPAGTYRTTVDAAGTAIKMRVQRLSDNQYLSSAAAWQAGATDCISVTDGSVTAAGRCGFWLAQNPTPSAFDTANGDQSSSAATGVTMTGPSSGMVGVPSTAFSIGVTPGGGTITGTLVVTPSDGGAGGTFTPSTVSLTTGSPAGSFTYTAASAGAKTISVTNGGGLTNPSNITYTATAANVAAVTNSALYFSPGNWYSDGGGSLGANNIKGSSTYAQSNTPGAYMKFKVTMVTTGNVLATFDNAHLSTVAAGDFPEVAVFRDGLAPVVTQLNGTSAQTITLASGLTAGTYTFVLLFKAAGLASSDRWVTPRLSVKFSSISIPSDGSYSAAPKRPGVAYIFGDSITEGLHNKGNSLNPADQDAGYTWAHMLAAALDCEVGIIGFGAQGYTTGGVGGVPQLISAWDLYSSGRSRLVAGALSPAADRIIIAHGENDTSGGGLSTNITSALAAIRAGSGSSPMHVLVPFTGKCRSDINAATLPANCNVIDVNGTGTDGSHLRYYSGNQSPLHPDIQGSAFLAPRLAKLIERGVRTQRTLTVTVKDAAGAGVPGLTGQKWAFFDQPLPSRFEQPADKGANGSTDGSGVCTLTVWTSLPSGGVGYLDLGDTDGTTTQSPDPKGLSLAVQVT